MFDILLFNVIIPLFLINIFEKKNYVLKFYRRGIKKEMGTFF